MTVITAAVVSLCHGNSCDATGGSANFAQLDAVVRTVSLSSEDWGVFSVCVVFLIVYALMARHVFTTSVKTRAKCQQKLSAACLTTLTAPLMSVVSLCCTLEVIQTQGFAALLYDTADFRHAVHSSPPLAQFACLFFAAHCVADMVVGCFLYKTELGKPSRFFHNVVFAFAMLCARANKIDTMFALTLGVTQLPALFLALAGISESWTFDVAYACSWTLSCMWYLIVADQQTEVLSGAYTWAVCVVWLGFAMHCWSLVGWASEKLGISMGQQKHFHAPGAARWESAYMHVEYDAESGLDETHSLLNWKTYGRPIKHAA